MLVGEYRFSVDSKGRTSLPAKFRKKIGKVVYLTRGIDGMIDVYTKDSWKKLEEKMSQLSMSKKADRDFKRLVLGAMSEVEPDKQGRIILSNVLREYAGIENGGRVVWVGVGDKAEIWSEDRWEKGLKDKLENFENISESLEGII